MILVSVGFISIEIITVIEFIIQFYILGASKQHSSEFIFDETYEFMNECGTCSKEFTTTEGLLLHMADHEICQGSSTFCSLSYYNGNQG